jgi:hypothetical protein
VQEQILLDFITDYLGQNEPADPRRTKLREAFLQI